MNTTNELPPLNLEQKMDSLIELVNSFRSAIMEEVQTIKADARERYVDLRQRIERLDTRMDRMEQRLHTIDKNLDAHVRELLDVKDRVREMEVTRELRH